MGLDVELFYEICLIHFYVLLYEMSLVENITHIRSTFIM